MHRPTTLNSYFSFSSHIILHLRRFCFLLSSSDSGRGGRFWFSTDAHYKQHPDANEYLWYAVRALPTNVPVRPPLQVLLIV
jgi:hypothetical protein